MLACRPVLERVRGFDESRALCYYLDSLARAKHAVTSSDVDQRRVRYRSTAKNVTADRRAVTLAMVKLVLVTVCSGMARFLQVTYKPR